MEAAALGRYRQVAMRFIGLTDLKGARIWVGVEWVAVVRPVLPHEFDNGNAVLEMGGYRQAVQETVEQVHQALDGAA
jgi:hypothetical protein